MHRFCRDVLRRNPCEIVESEELVSDLRDTLNEHLRTAWGSNFELKISVEDLKDQISPRPKRRIPSSSGQSSEEILTQNEEVVDANAQKEPDLSYEDWVDKGRADTSSTRILDGKYSFLFFQIRLIDLNPFPRFPVLQIQGNWR
eukprot:gb/GECH01005214.1/.p1 GENE.gb/GECH01005214.1/~~gb/GECH01005214.1/.p1  ORF type:complete len:144 (+),score=2.63 gb/GECH01005214.1/:1-432(+)